MCLSPLLNGSKKRKVVGVCDKGEGGVRGGGGGSGQVTTTARRGRVGDRERG